MKREKNKKRDKTVMIVTGAGVAIGLAEALLYYNLGKNANSKSFKFGIPKGKELLQTLTVVAVTSVLTALISKGIENAVTSEKRNSQMA
ncbi:hypothetical protein [Aquimarina megaterium]|uniref:hypothetical protein n=1 Tax=Aquimarina megaterium TaxID=1443666 RepID=UPI000471FFF0|nr:hypothetical protein [Aquimarina megaterium]